MQHKHVLIAAVLGGAAALLSGCGDSHPIPATPATASASSSAVIAKSSHSAASPPSVGVFHAFDAEASSTAVQSTSNCNVDAIADNPAGSHPVPRDGSSLFSGWAADKAGDKPPAQVRIVLAGAQDYAVIAATGAPRPDVASALHKPGLAMSGFRIKADLAAVPAGEYGVMLSYAIGGKTFACPTKVRLTVQ